MKKKKIKYILLLIIATVILVADLVILAMSGRAMSAMPGGSMGFSQNGELPEGFDAENMPEGFGGGSMPGGFDMENMPEGFDGGSMPGGFDAENMPEGFDAENMPESFGGGKSSNSMIGKVRIVCIVVAILCTLIDLFCVIRLIKIRKEERKLNEVNGPGASNEAKKTPDCPIDPVEARLKKKKQNRIKWIIVAVVLLLLVLLLQILSGGSKASSSSTVKEEVISAVAENGTIEQSMKGSGVLETASDVEVTVPGNITVTKYLVSNGDFVEAGDPIAVVEKKSVMAAIADLQEVIDEVDDAIEDAKEESITSSIKATVDGTVVAVYGKKGEDVLDVMYEKGALMLLSLDNLLAVQVENPGSVNVGDKLTIKDKDGNSATGKIVQVEKDTIVVTVSLSKFSFEEEVTVYGAEEKSLGTGKLYIYSQQKVTGFSGTISSVKVSKGDKVSAGNTLLTLSDTDYTAAYQNLLNKRIVLEEQYNQLVEVGNSGYVYAKEAGSISNIDDSLVVSAATENIETASAKIDDNLVATGNNVIRTSHTSGGMILTSQRNQTGFILTTADTSTEGTTKEEETTPAETVSKSVNLVWLNSDGNAMTEGMPQQVVVQLCNGETILDEQILDANTEWKYSWTELEKYASDGNEIPYTIKIKDVVEGYTVTTQIIDSVTLLIFTKEAEKTPSTDNPNGEQPGEMPDDSQQGVLPDGSQGDSSQMPDGNGSTGNMPSMSGTPDYSPGGSNMSSGITSQYPGGETVQETEPEYTFEETVICSLSPNDIVEIPITIDELDINKVKEGQKCSITLDAFASQSFEGVIEDINYSGENSGGNTKYTVTVSMEKKEQMLLGMNASVTIGLSTVSNIVTIPVEALVEQDGAVYVYTEYNEKEDELDGLVEVKTGISDGKNVQILEGLEAEQDYYYRYADTIAYTFIR